MKLPTSSKAAFLVGSAQVLRASGSHSSPTRPRRARVQPGARDRAAQSAPPQSKRTRAREALVPLLNKLILRQPATTSTPATSETARAPLEEPPPEGEPGHGTTRR